MEHTELGTTKRPGMPQERDLRDNRDGGRYWDTDGRYWDGGVGGGSIGMTVMGEGSWDAIPWM